jgi:hypothetical protein
MAPARPPIAKSGKSTGNGGNAPAKGSAVPAGKGPGNQRRGRQAAWQARRKRNRMLAVGSVVVVVALVAVLIVVKVSGGGSGGAPRKPAPAAVVAKLTSIPVSTLVNATADKNLKLYSPQPAAGGPITSGGHPEMLFIGAEFCPICATERWPILVALSHFGTFSNVQQTHSALSDGDIPTLSFYGSTFTSKYLTFVSVENTTNQPSGKFYKILQVPTATESSLWTANETAQGESAQAYPFIDIGGKWSLIAAQFADTTLEGHSFATIANSIGSNENTIGVNVDASAAVLIKAICDATGQQPAATCKAVAGVSMGTTSTGASTPAG